MVKREVTVPETNCDGRALATMLVTLAEKFKAQTVIRADSRVVNAKSIMGVISMCITKGDRFFIVSDGIDEEDALDALVGLVESGFQRK